MKFKFLICLALFIRTESSMSEIIFKDGFDVIYVFVLVTGVESTGLEVQLNSGPITETMSILEDGTFVFNNGLEPGQSWQVAITSLPNQPTNQTCDLSNESGISAQDPIWVQVDCASTEWLWNQMNWNEGGWTNDN